MAEQNVLTLIKELKTNPLVKETLSSFQRRLVVIHLLEEMKYTHAQIAIWVGLTTKRIDQINVERKKDCARYVKAIDADALIGQYMNTYHKVRQKLAEQEDWSGVWRVTRDLIIDLQGLGILRKVPEELNISLTEKARQWEEMFGLTVTRNEPAKIEVINANNN